MIAALSLDKSPTGATNALFTSRGLTQVPGGTAGQEPNYVPYFTFPNSIDSIISVATGSTSYIPIIAADANMTDLFLSVVVSGASANAASITFGALTAAPNGSTMFNYPTSGVTGPGYPAGIPYGGWGGVTFSAAVLRIAPFAGATASFACSATATDARGATGVISFTVRMGF